MLDVEELLRELNEVLAKHQARMYVMGYEFDAWVNHEGEDWPHETARLWFQDGRIRDTKELY